MLIGEIISLGHYIYHGLRKISPVAGHVKGKSWLKGLTWGNLNGILEFLFG